MKKVEEVTKDLDYWTQKMKEVPTYSKEYNVAKEMKSRSVKRLNKLRNMQVTLSEMSRVGTPRKYVTIDTSLGDMIATLAFAEQKLRSVPATAKCSAYQAASQRCRRLRKLVAEKMACKLDELEVRMACLEN